MSRCTKRHCIFNAETLNPECDLISCPYRTEANDLKTEREIVLEELAKEDLQVLALAYVYAKNMHIYGVDVTKAICSATENLAMLEKAFIGWWIPVSEEMPEDGQNVLFCDNTGDIMVGYHIRGGPDTHFTQVGSFEVIKNVKAWMPLPDAYKPQKGEEV